MSEPKSRHRSPEKQLILVSAGTAERRHAMLEHAQELGRSSDWTALVELLNARRLMPTLGPRIAGLAGQVATEQYRGALERSLAAARRQGTLLALAASQVQEALAQAGIRCSSLKGPRLSEELYGDPGRRLASDVDVLVARDQLNEAVSVVRRLGYAPPTDPIDERGLPLLHFAMVHERGELPPVELHWRIHSYEDDYAQQRLLAPLDAGDEWRPAPVDQLAALLLFYARDGFMNLRLATDVGAWWDAFGSNLAAGSLDETADEYPALARALLVSARVTERIVGLPAAKVADCGHPLKLRERIAARLADPHPTGSQPQLYANMGLIEGLLTPPGGLRGFLRRQVIPSRRVLQEHPRAVPGHRPSSRIGHAMRVLGRYALALLGLLRPHRVTLPG